MIEGRMSALVKLDDARTDAFRCDHLGGVVAREPEEVALVSVLYVVRVEGSDNQLDGRKRHEYVRRGGPWRKPRWRKPCWRKPHGDGR